MNDNPIHGWLIEATDRGASDLHLIAGYLPAVRLHGRLIPIASESLDPKQISDWLLDLLPEEGRERLRAQRNADFAIDIPRGKKRQRYRANYFYASDANCDDRGADRIPVP